MELSVMSHHHYHHAQIGLDDLQSLYSDTNTRFSDSIIPVNTRYQNNSEYGHYYYAHYSGGGSTMLLCKGSEVLLTNIDRSIWNINVGPITMDACVIGPVCANHRVLVCVGLPGCREREVESVGDEDVKLVDNFNSDCCLQ